MSFTKIQEMKKQTMEMVLEVIASGASTYIDDHTDEVQEIEGWVILDGCDLCPVISNTRYFSLNPLYYSEKDDRLRLSRMSTGGVIAVFQHASLKDAIEAYKKEAEENKFMKKITDYVIITAKQKA